MTGTSDVLGSRVVLLWLPVGAGGHVVKHTSRWWEVVRARAERREPAPLVHAALEVEHRGARFVVEMAPAWNVPAAERTVVAGGPVGLRLLGRSRFFRYEVRCWRDGVIPDRSWAVGEPVVLTRDERAVALLLDTVPRAPSLTWGRTVRPTGDMWNSNSLVSWLLAEAGVATDVVPPEGRRAPGWAAGLVLVGRGRPATPGPGAPTR